MHEEKLGRIINGPFHFAGPLLSWDLRVCPQWLYGGHEATVLHLLLRIIAVPPPILKLITGQPVDRPPHPTIITVAQLDQCPNHVARQTRLIPSFPTPKLARTDECSRLCLVQV